MNPPHTLRLCALAIAAMAAGAQAADEPRFPDPATAWRTEGTWVDPASVQRVAPGLTADQVRSLIGVPHFNEGFRVREWNYIFQRRLRGEPTTCQYQLHFDEHGQVQRIDWQRPACAEAQ
jgi:outer membrane protein assembly factor BamE (lipoprotein component of BamABCDE complex)